MKICPKCGYQRTDKENYNPEYECPKCGVIDSKVKKIIPKRLAPDKADNTSNQIESSVLSPEERKKIYEEEKLRFETRTELEREKKDTEDKKKKKQQEEDTKNLHGGCLLFLGITIFFYFMMSLCSKILKLF